jgi:hypothetical protein
VVWEPFRSGRPVVPVRALLRSPLSRLEVDGGAVTGPLLILALPMMGLIAGPERSAPAGEAVLPPLVGAVPALRFAVELMTLVLGVSPAGAALILVALVGPSTAGVRSLVNPSWAEPAGEFVPPLPVPLVPVPVEPPAVVPAAVSSPPLSVPPVLLSVPGVEPRGSVDGPVAEPTGAPVLVPTLASGDAAPVVEPVPGAAPLPMVVPVVSAPVVVVPGAVVSTAVPLASGGTGPTGGATGPGAGAGSGTSGGAP